MNITQTIVAASLCGLVGTSYAQEPEVNVDPSVECPDFVRGAKLSMREVDGGVELKITTPWTVHLTQLRQMLHQLAVVIEDHTHTQPVSVGEQTDIPPIDITVKDVQSGAVITVKADKSTNIPLVREQAKLLDDFWQGSECINGKISRMATR